MKIIAFYLPQFHNIPENDEWWGDGFTEWTNVKKAKPLYEGHMQPRVPLGGNYYNLLDDNVKIWQADLAKKYGVYGFCYYHYWFNGKMLLEKPMEQMLANKEVDIPFCICWANEPWTKAWVGDERKLLIAQEYGQEEEWKQHFMYLLPFFKDERYITKNGKFGALGHGITDADTGTLMDLRGGELYETKILDIIKGQKGAPGELEGYINMVAKECIGKIDKNTSLGIFGTIFEPDKQQRTYYEVGLRQDIKTGKAWIYSNMEGTPQKYEIQIEKINRTSKDNKGMVIRVTDTRLLKLTGGIVQGMSGSPILQDDKIIGAVTHVFVEEPTKGYAVFMENMLDT